MIEVTGIKEESETLAKVEFSYQWELTEIGNQIAEVSDKDNVQHLKKITLPYPIAGEDISATVHIDNGAAASVASSDIIDYFEQYCVKVHGAILLVPVGGKNKQISSENPHSHSAA